jgi:hypothetical protein
MKAQGMRHGCAGLNPSLWRDLERRLGTSDLLEWLENEAERVANLGRTHVGRVQFSQVLLRDRGIGVLHARPYLPALATIRWRGTGYEVAYSSYQRTEDRRFAVAHEIAHTFWFAPGTEGQPLSLLQRVLGDDPTIEWLCNRGAAAMLLPRGDLTKVLESAPNVLHRIPELAKRYVVPERLVARRVFHDLGGREFCVAGVRLDSKDSQPRQGRVVWFAPFPGRALTKKRVQGRIVPWDLLPDVPLDTTGEVELDGRWVLLAESASRPERAKPLSDYPPLPPRRAWVGRTTEAWYVAIPRE